MPPPQPLLPIQTLEKADKKLEPAEQLLPIDELAEKIRDKRIITREELKTLTIVLSREFPVGDVKSNIYQ